MAKRQASTSEQLVNNGLSAQISYIMKYSEMTFGRMEAVINKLGGMEGVEKFLRGETIVSAPERKWREQDGIIYFSVTSDGTTGAEWIDRLTKKGFRLSDYAKSILRSKDFKPTSGVTTEIAVLKGLLFEDNDRITTKIRAFATERKLEAPNAEIAVLIRENFSDEDIEAMSLYWIVAMHEPIKDSGGDPDLLYVDRYDVSRWLGARCDGPDYRWSRGDGFAFAVSQVG